MSSSNKPRSQYTQEHSDIPPYIFDPRDADSIDFADLEEMYRDGPDPEPPYGETPQRWLTIRAKIILRELCDLIRLDRQKHHPIDLKIIADLAFVATDDAGDEGHWITYWCIKFDPDITAGMIADLIDGAGPRFWYGDDIAKAFDITAADRDRFALCHVGACDDDDHAKRNEYKRARNAAYNRKYRAKKRSGRKPGRPPLEMTVEEKKAHRRQQQNESKRRRRGDKKCVSPSKTHNQNLYKEISRNKCRHPSDVSPAVVWITKTLVSDLRKMIRLVSITAPVTEIGIFDLPMAA